MAVFSAPAIVLFRTESTSVDRLYTVLTSRQGKVTLLGKGTKRITSKLAGSLEPPRIVTVWIAHGKSIDRITGCVSRESFSATRRHLWNAVILQAFSEAVDMLARPGQEDPALFAMVRNVLTYIESVSARQLPVQRIALDVALWRLIAHAGWRPVLDRCVICKRSLPDPSGVPVAFSIRLGGLVCKHHAAEGAQPLEPKLRALLTASVRGDSLHGFSMTKSAEERFHALTVGALEHAAERPLRGDRLLQREAFPW